jgi:hypothetical protein
VSEPFAALLDAPERALDLPLPEAVTALARYAAVVEVLRARVATANGAASGPTEAHPPEKPKDRLLTLGDAVERSRKSRRWFHDHWRDLPFARKVGRTILFPEPDFERWLRRS